MDEFDSDFDEDIKQNENAIIYLDSDVEETDIYDDNDLFGKDNEQYNKISAFPSIPCPSSSNNE
jgi:hypothetical protein